MKNSNNNKTAVIFAIIMIIVVNVFFLLDYKEPPARDGRPHNDDNPPMTASISSDGKYIVTSQLNQQLTLWNISKRTHKLISLDANIYSARFIQNSDNFLWQNVKTNEVYVMNIKGKIVKQFNTGFPVYNHIMTSDLKYYVASTKNWDIVWRHNNVQRVIAEKYNNSGFYTGKTIHFAIHKNLLLTSGDTDIDSHAGVGIWNITTGKQLYNLLGDEVLTYGTFSPNGKYAVTGDDNARAFVWDTATGKRRFMLTNIWYDKKENKINPPKDFHSTYGTELSKIIALKFIDKNHYLRFSQNISYIILYNINHPYPIKYIKFADIPYLANVDTTQDTINTSVSAHILVIGHTIKPGLSVYQYYPKSKTIRRIWTCDLPRHKYKKTLPSRIRDFIFNLLL